MTEIFLLTILQLVTNQTSISFEIKLAYTITSILISFGILMLARSVIHIRLSELRGKEKLLTFVTMVVLIFEFFYLAILYGLFEIANEVLASIGIASGLIVLAMQNFIKSVFAGIGIYLNPEIDVGDVIEIDGKKGVITEIHLTRTVIMSDEGIKYFIPNLKFNEAVVGIS